MLGPDKVYIFNNNTKFQDFLQRERYGCAQLQNFAAGLELIGQKVRINSIVVSLMFRTMRKLNIDPYKSLHFEEIYLTSMSTIEIPQLQMSELQNRLDAEFLLAQMCSVKFKEWIVVLATLLQRSEVKSFNFHHHHDLKASH